MHRYTVCLACMPASLIWKSSSHSSHSKSFPNENWGWGWILKYHHQPVLGNFLYIKKTGKQRKATPNSLSKFPIAHLPRGKLSFISFGLLYKQLFLNEWIKETVCARGKINVMLSVNFDTSEFLVCVCETVCIHPPTRIVLRVHEYEKEEKYPMKLSRTCGLDSHSAAHNKMGCVNKMGCDRPWWVWSNCMYLIKGFTNVVKTGIYKCKAGLGGCSLKVSVC